MVDVCRTDILHETKSLDEGEKTADRIRTLEQVGKHLKARNVPLLLTWAELYGNIREVRNQIVHDNSRRHGAGPGRPDDDAAKATMQR